MLKFIDRPKLISSTQYAKQMGWTRQYVNRLIREGRLQAEFIEGNWYVWNNAERVPVKMGRPRKTSRFL